MIRLALISWRLAGTVIALAGLLAAADLLSPRQHITGVNGETVYGPHTLQAPFEYGLALAALTLAVAVLVTIAALTSTALHRAEH